MISKTAKSRSRIAPQALSRAEIVAFSDADPTVAQVRAAPEAGPSPCRAATLALAGYHPSVGDRVLVAPVDGELCIVGVTAAARAPEIALEGGGAIRARDGVAEVVDRDGRVLVRVADGAMEIAAPSGDLTLSAPAGRVSLRAAKDIEIDAARDLVHRAGRSVETVAGQGGSASRVRLASGAATVDAKRLSVRAGQSELVTEDATVVAGRIRTTAARVVSEVEHLELTALRIVEKTRDVIREATDLAETRVGRARTIVRGLYSLSTRRTTLASEEETSVDGSRILLG